MFGAGGGAELFGVKAVEFFPFLFAEQGAQDGCPEKFFDLGKVFKFGEEAPRFGGEEFLIESGELIGIGGVGKGDTADQGGAGLVGGRDEGNPPFAGSFEDAPGEFAGFRGDGSF